MKIKAAVLAIALIAPQAFASTFSCMVNDRLNGGQSVATVQEYDAGYKMNIFASGVEFETQSWMTTKTHKSGAVVNQSFPAMVKAQDGSEFMVTMQKAYKIDFEDRPVFTVFANEKLWLITTECVKMDTL